VAGKALALDLRHRWDTLRHGHTNEREATEQAKESRARFFLSTHFDLRGHPICSRWWRDTFQARS
jgi:ribonuclease BN (tRNA processing enzyme)